MTDAITIRMSHDEALVLSVWLERFNERDDVEFVHEAERRVLWSLEGLLEPRIENAFSPTFAADVAKARERLVADDRPRSEPE